MVVATVAVVGGTGAFGGDHRRAERVFGGAGCAECGTFVRRFHAAQHSIAHATAVAGRIVGRRLNLSPLVILLSIILWGWVLGLMGGLLAVPMTLLVRRMLVEAYDESRWITGLLGRPVRDAPPPLAAGPGAGARGSGDRARGGALD